MICEYDVFKIHIVLKSGTLGVCKQNTFRCSISVTIFSVLIWDTFLQCRLHFMKVLNMLHVIISSSMESTEKRYVNKCYASQKFAGCITSDSFWDFIISVILLIFPLQTTSFITCRTAATVWVFIYDINILICSCLSPVQILSSFTFFTILKFAL